MLKFAYGLAFGGFGFAIFGTRHPHWPFAYLVLSLYFSLCWVVWFACAFKWRERNQVALLGLWALIDIGILVELAMCESAHGHGPLSGAEFLYLFSFAPVILPFGLGLSFIGGIVSLDRQDWLVFGPTLAYVLPDWIEASLIAAVQSACVVWCGRRILAMRRRPASHAQPESL